GEGLHQVAVAAFPQRSEPGELAAVPGQPARVDEHSSGQTWARPGCGLLCCRIRPCRRHLNLPEFRMSSGGSSTTSPLPHRCPHVGETVAFRARPGKSQLLIETSPVPAVITKTL